MLSSTTSVIVCDVDLNLDGQEFAALRSEQRDPSRPVHGDAQRPTQRRSARHRPAASSTATRSRCCGNARRGPPWRAQRTARARRTARALGPRLLERRGRRAHDARHALGACHMRDGRGPSRRINAAAPRGPPPRGPPPLGAASRLRHESMMGVRILEFAGVCFGAKSFSWYKMVTRASSKQFGKRLPPSKYAHI